MQMAERGGNQGAGGTWEFGNYVTALRLAASFLTVVPVGPRGQAADEELAASFGMFPLVGFILGAALALEDLLLTPLFGAGIRSALVILTSVAITGALHLDALADTADALGAGVDRTHALEILRDSSIGVFGSIAIFSWLGLQWIALAGLQGPLRTAAIYLAPGVGRWAMVAVAAGLDYLRPAGAGAFLKPESAWSNLRIASAIAVVAVLPVFSFHARAAAAAAIAVVLALRWFYRRWLGGMTGDLLGAAGALAELAAMLAMAARIP
jgi:adenosylcobinamide-GDP ribazoletransferase